MPDAVQEEEIAPRVRHDVIVERDPLAQPGKVEADLVRAPIANAMKLCFTNVINL